MKLIQLLRIFEKRACNHLKLIFTITPANFPLKSTLLELYETSGSFNRRKRQKMKKIQIDFQVTKLSNWVKIDR